MKIAISVDSSGDLSKEICTEYDIHVVPFHILLGDKSYLDGELTQEQMFEYVKQNKTLPKTSAVNQYQYLEHFKKLLETYDEVIHIGFSSCLSSAYQNANLAIEEFNGRVHLIDSRNLSVGHGIQAIKARMFLNEGKSLQETIASIELLVNKANMTFVCSAVDYLYKGGRCSKVAALGANLFHICPQIILRDGVMDSGVKFRGTLKSVTEQYFKQTFSQFPNPDLSIAIFVYTIADVYKQDIFDYVQRTLTNRGFKKIYFVPAMGTISTHCGPNGIGLAFYNQ